MDGFREISDIFNDCLPMGILDFVSPRPDDSYDTSNDYSVMISVVPIMDEISDISNDCLVMGILDFVSPLLG